MCSLEHYLHYNFTVHGVIKINYNLRKDAVREDFVSEDAVSVED